MQFSSGIVLALCILFVEGQNIAKEKCSKYLDLTKQKASILFLSAIPKVEKVESSLCSKTVDLIVGGKDANPGEFPHQAVLVVFIRCAKRFNRKLVWNGPCDYV
ncbi:hypothetical protein quinque_010427 [Culex quinquefasciatus]